MRLGAIQSNYIPWRGYFDFIKSCDLFVFHDCVQYTKGDWRNRNKVKLYNGVHWISIPVKSCPVDTNINEVVTVEGWEKSHRNLLEQSFSQSPHRKEAMELWNPVGQSLSSINQGLAKGICEYLGVETPLMDSAELKLEGKKTDRLIDLCKKVGADTYLSGPAAKCYLDVPAMNDAGIKVEWMEYGYQPYPQPWGEFKEVTVLDLIANTGPEARNYL